MRVCVRVCMCWEYAYVHAFLHTCVHLCKPVYESMLLFWCVYVCACVQVGGRWWWWWWWGGGGYNKCIGGWICTYMNRCECILYTSVLLFPLPPTLLSFYSPSQKAKHDPQPLLHASTLCPSLSLGRTCDQQAPTEGLYPIPSLYLACESSRSSPVREWTLWFCRGFPSPRVVASMNFWGMLMLLVHAHRQVHWINTQVGASWYSIIP